MALFSRGDIIRFTYPSRHDRFKQVFVIHELWNGKMHGLDMKRMTAAEREVLRFVMNPKNKGKRHRIPLINDIMTRMDPPTLLENPVSFYNQFVKQFIKNKDVYRTYYPPKMTGIQRVDSKVDVITTAGNKPLFGG
jgi:hypothetical protein